MERTRTCRHFTHTKSFLLHLGSKAYHLVSVESLPSTNKGADAVAIVKGIKRKQLYSVKPNGCHCALHTGAHGLEQTFNSRGRVKAPSPFYILGPRDQSINTRPLAGS